MLAKKTVEFLIPAAYSSITSHASITFCFQKGAGKLRIEWILLLYQ